MPTDDAADTRSARTAGDRLVSETHWRMNAATRRILDDAVAAAVAAHGEAPFDVVLDVGCGRQSNVVFPGARCVVGTDVDAEGLAENTTIDIAVIADIVTADVPEASVDAVACIWVLEHLPAPDLVLAKLARALRPGGVMVLAVPNPAAPKALLTRWTPLWFHRLVYERLLGRADPDAGHPFETVVDGSLRPDRLEHLAELCQLDVVHRTDFEDNKQRQAREVLHLTGRAWGAVRRISRAVTRSHVDPAESDAVFTFQRRHRAPTGDLADAITRASPAPEAG